MHLPPILVVLLEGLGVVMLADFVAGLVHWAEDAYWTENTPVLGPLLIRANIVHHHYPRYFTRLSWWQSSRDLVLISVALLAIGAWLGGLTWQLWLFAIVSANANQVHKWAHRTRAENGRVISFFQDIGLLLTPRNHAVHHSDPKNTHYCPVTNLVNPLLEIVRFWSALEWIVWRLTGVRHRHDTSNRGQGPGPAWLQAYRSTPKPTTPPTTSVAPRNAMTSPRACVAPACARCATRARRMASGSCSRRRPDRCSELAEFVG